MELGIRESPFGFWEYGWKLRLGPLCSEELVAVGLVLA
jgi:hypothetical protein